MSQTTECPKCTRELSAYSYRCVCGWKKPQTQKTSESEKIIFICEFREHSLPCGKKEVNRYGDSWLCRDHGDEWILKKLPDSIQAAVIRGARQHIEYAKAAGMTNREWAEETGFVKKFEEWRQGMNRRSDGDVKHISEVF